MSKTETRSGSGFGFGLFTLFMLAVFISLGVWQLQRRVEKHALIAALDTRLAAAPVPLPPPAQWNSLTRAADEFRRVTFTATYEQRPDAMVFSSGSAIRADVSGPGTWAFMPARLPDGDVVVVNTGFVQNTMQDRAQQDRAVGRLVTGQPVVVTGYLRFLETAGMLTPKQDTTKRLWFARDVGAMTQALGWAPRTGASRRSTSISRRRCREAENRSPGRCRSISGTITCNTPSPGSASPPPC
jgi:cytochrome oxidase assembly protein ShyY1